MNHPDALYCYRTKAVGSSTNCGPSAGVDNCARVDRSLDRQVVCAHSNIGENEIVAVSTGGLQNKLNGGRKITRPGPRQAADCHVDHAIAERLSECLYAGIQDGGMGRLSRSILRLQNSVVILSLTTAARVKGFCNTFPSTPRTAPFAFAGKGLTRRARPGR